MTRHLGGALLLLSCLAYGLLPKGLPAQEPQGWRARFAAAQEAAAGEDWSSYAREAAAAAEAMEPGLLNRPFVQYHAARAHALLGEAEGAVAWLDRMWEEDIEALMVSFARYDPAFDAAREHPGYRRIMQRPGSMELGVERLGGRVWRVSGAGSNVVASVGEDGVLLVDTGYGPALPALRRALAGIASGAAPGSKEAVGAGGGEGVGTVDVLVLTHPHEDHWGAVAGLAPEAVVMAHPGTAAAMGEPLEFMQGVRVPPRPPAARPDAQVRDTTFAFNGEGVRVFGVEAHTGSDLAVHFPGSQVVALGDAWLAGNALMFPGGEAPDAFLDGLQRFLEALPAGTVVVGGHDPPTAPAAVLDQIRVTRRCMAEVRAALSRGESVEETAAGADDDCPPAWVAYFHRALAEPAAG